MTAEQHGNTATDDDATKKLIIRLGDEWAAAEKEKDVQAVAELLADEYQLTTTKGTLISKADWLSILPNIVVFRFDRYEIDVRLFGETAVLNGMVNMKIQNSDKLLTGVFRYADVFVRRAGRWNVVYSHFTPINDNSGG